jgi:hypothetical protein
MVKIGRLLTAFLFFASATVFADSEFTATIDKGLVSLDESVSLRISVKTEGHAALGQPLFSAPDFEFINEYQSTYMESIFENGKFLARNTQTLTKVLRPKRVGTFTISKLQISISGKIHTAPDIQVTVRPGGQGAPQPRGYGGAGVGLRGAGKNSHGPPVIVRAEISKSKAYKGEQIIVDYFLYRKVRVFNIQVEKFPMLNGFLKEDLSIPVLQRLDTDQVTLDGTVYERSLLAKYAAYPLEVGKMRIDTLSLKYNFYSNQSNFGDSDDPFANFFQQLSPRAGQTKSDLVSVDVLPLPTDGRPTSFSGGVGDFTVSSSVSGTDVRANEALTFTVKIEGQGNLAAIEEPKANWPDNIEVYDTKGKAKMGAGGVGEKSFEFLLIPRNQGRVTLPAIEFSFFDSAKNTYVTRSTKPIDINVLPALPGSVQVSAKRKSNKDSEPSTATEVAPKKENLRYLKPPVEERAPELSGVPFWRAIFWIAVSLILLFVGFVVRDSIRRGEKLKARSALSESKNWDNLLVRASKVGNGTGWNEVVQIYELLMGAIFDAIDQVYSVGSRSLSRAELERILVENHGLSSDLWRKIASVLEYGEFVRFAISSHTGADQKAKEDLSRWVKEGKALAKKLAKT